MAAVAKKLNGWMCDDVTFASFQVRHEASSAADLSEGFHVLLQEVAKDKVLADTHLLVELAAPFDDVHCSKWSALLPASYRWKLIAGEAFDVESTRKWIGSVIE